MKIIKNKEKYNFVNINNKSIKKYEHLIISNFENLFLMKAGGDVSKINVKSEKEEDFLYPVYSNYISNFGIYGYSNSFQINQESITITARGTIGKTNFRLPKFTAIGRLIYLTNNKFNNNLKYFSFLIDKLKLKGEDGVIKSLTIPMLKNHFLCYNPDLKQQEKIAHILSTQEEQIERIKGLIKKLEKRNQYYAEKLLSGELRIRENEETGKTEFYENEEWQEVVFGCDIIKKKRRFPIEWKKDKLLNNIKLTKGISINSSKFNYENKGFQFLRTGDVWEDASSKKIPAFYDDKIEDKFFKNKYDYISCFEGFNKIPKKGTIGLVTNNGVGIISSHLYKTENMKINGKYIAVSLLNLSYIQDILMKNAIGSTVLSSTKCLKDIEFLFPDKEESIKIEKILSNLFKEVEILKELLPKEEKRFQWMLDNLLSGEYEVVED